MRHDERNTNCDKVRYKGSDEVVCTCDEDTPEPSTVMPTSAAGDAFAPNQFAGGVMLIGREAQLYAEFRAASRELDAARRLLEPAQARWKAALDALATEASVR